MVLCFSGFGIVTDVVDNTYNRWVKGGCVVVGLGLHWMQCKLSMVRHG